MVRLVGMAAQTRQYNGRPRAWCQRCAPTKRQPSRVQRDRLKYGEVRVERVEQADGPSGRGGAREAGRATVEYGLVSERCRFLHFVRTRRGGDEFRGCMGMCMMDSGLYRLILFESVVDVSVEPRVSIRCEHVWDLRLC